MSIEKKARRLFAKAFPWMGWPQGWRVQWADTIPDAFGITVWDDKRITICKLSACQNSKEHLEDTLIHEMVHMIHGPSLPHGRAFSQRVRWAKHRAKAASKR